jgi:hypothetical protein
LAYNIPQKFLEGTFLKGVRVYAQGINLAVWTEFEGFDPEDDNNIGQFEFPNPRQLTAGLDITF